MLSEWDRGQEQEETLERGAVIVNFMCQFDGAMVCPDIWLHIFEGMFVREFLCEINLESVD